MDKLKLDFSFLENKNKPSIRSGRLSEPSPVKDESSFTFDTKKLDFSFLRTNEDGSPKETISQMDTPPKKDYPDTLKGKYEKWYDEKYVPFAESDFAKGFQDKFNFMDSPTIQNEPISKVRGGTSVDKTAVNYLNKTQEGREFLKEGHSDEELLKKANELRRKSVKELSGDTSFNIGQAAGSMGKFAGLYAMGGGTVEKAVAPMFEKLGLSAGAGVSSAIPTGAVGSNLTTTGLNTLGNFLTKAAPVLATEYSKDVLLGQPIHYMDAKDRGLEGMELAKYLGKENMIDVAANGLFYGFGKAIGNIKGNLDKQLAKLKEADFEKTVGGIKDLITQMSRETGLPENEVRKSLVELYDTRIKPFNDYKMGEKTLKLLDNKATKKRVSDAMLDMDIKKATQVKENLEETWNEVAELIQMKYGTSELSGSQVDNLKNEIGIDVANLAERLVKADEHLEVLMKHRADPNMVMNTDSIIKRMKYGLVDDNVDNIFKDAYFKNVQKLDPEEIARKGIEGLDDVDTGVIKYFDEYSKYRPKTVDVQQPKPPEVQEPKADIDEPKLPDVEERAPTKPEEVGYKAPEPETKKAKDIIDNIESTTKKSTVEDLETTPKVDEPKTQSIKELEAEVMNYDSTREFAKANKDALKEAGLDNMKKVRLFVKDVRYKATQDYRPTSIEEAVAIIKAKTRKNDRLGWLNRADNQYKPKLEDQILSDKEVRNATMNMAWHNYKMSVDPDISFNDFLNKEITVYRAGNFKFNDDDVFISYTFDPKMAVKFGDNMTTKRIKMKDTLGTLQTIAENEIMVRRRPLGVLDNLEDLKPKEQVVKSVDTKGNPILEELNKAQAEKGATKTSKFTKTAKGYAALNEEVSRIINDVDYKSLKNSEIRAIASRLADKYPNEALTIIRDVKTSFRNDLEAATALEYVVKMQDESPELAGQLIEDISRKFTVSGKVVQIASMWSRITKKGLDGFMASLEKRYDYNIPDDLKNEAISQWATIEATMENPQLREMLITNYLSATKKLFSGRTLQDIAARDGVDIDRLIASVPDKIKATILNQDPKEMETWLDRFMRDKSTKQLQEANRQVLLGRIRDTIPKSAGRQLSTVQAFAHLLNIKTFLRNIISNTTFNAMEDFSNVLAWGADYAMYGMGYSPVRSVALPTLNLGTQGKRFMEGLTESSANIRLGIKSGSAGKYTLGNYGSSFSSETFKGRVGQSLERLLSYELQATDEAYKNVVRGNILDQLKKLSDDGVITDEMRNIAEQEALYRTFQDDSLPAHILNQVGDLLNTIPLAPRKIVGTTGRMVGNREVMSFGLKDLTVKYTKVPGNIIARAVEYSPIGYFKAISLLSKMNSGSIPVDQNTLRQLNMTLGRVATGSGMLAFGKWLADKGVLFTQDPSNTPTKSAFEKAQGLGNTQLNISAIDRFLEGVLSATEKDYELGERVNGYENLTELLTTKKGDKLLTINNLAEPFSKPLALGATVSKIQDGKGNYLEDVQQLVNSTWEEIVDLPTMSVIKSMTYQDGFLQAAAVPIVQAVPGFIPSVIRHAANYQVPEQREAYSGNMAEQFKRQVMQNLPGLREKVPERLSPIGTTYGGSGGEDRLMDLMNAAVSPGRTDIYNPVNYDDILQNVQKELDTTDHYPSKSAPKKMTIDGIERELDDEQKEYFQKTYGQLINQLYSEVADEIREASVEEQHAVLTSLKRRARAYAREKTTERYFMGNQLPGL